VIDSQSVRAADTVPKASRGWDAAKKVNGRKRHIAVDAIGLLLAVVVTPACVQDRDAARPLLWNLRRACTQVRLAWADAGYQAGRLTAWASALRITLQLVRRPDDLAHLRRTATPLGGRAQLRLDQQIPPHRPRLRTARPAPRGDTPMGHDRGHGPAARPPPSAKTSMTSSQTLT
jgi:transposase